MFIGRVGLQAKREVLSSICGMVELLCDMARVIENLSAVNSDGHGPLYRRICVLKICIGIECPGICIQSPHIMPRCDLLLCKFQCIVCGNWMFCKNQNEVKSRFIGCRCRIARKFFELRVCALCVLKA